MAVKTYTLSELKTLVLTQMNNIKGLAAAGFGSTDSDEAYDRAVQETGFENPTITDDDRAKKYTWLIQRMRRWYLGRLWEQYILRFEAGDLKADQIARNLQTLCEKLDEDFEKAKTDSPISYLFTNSDAIYGTAIVLPSGFVDNRIGESIEDRT